MFKNRAFQVKLVNDKKQNANAETVESIFDPEKIVQILKDNSKNILIGIVAAVVAVKIVDTTCDIAVIAADAHFNK